MFCHYRKRVTSSAFRARRSHSIHSSPRATSAPPIAFQTGSPNATIAAPAHPSELLTAVRMFHEPTSEPGRDTVTRDELKRELDTLRRLIESRK